jgi:hypothetical protein
MAAAKHGISAFTAILDGVIFFAKKVPPSVIAKERLVCLGPTSDICSENDGVISILTGDRDEEDGSGDFPNLYITEREFIYVHFKDLENLIETSFEYYLADIIASVSAANRIGVIPEYLRRRVMRKYKARFGTSNGEGPMKLILQ